MKITSKIFILRLFSVVNAVHITTLVDLKVYFTGLLSWRYSDLSGDVNAKRLPLNL